MRMTASPDGFTIIIGNPIGEISKILISGKMQTAPNEFNAVLNRFGDINGLQYRDYIDSMMNLKERFESMSAVAV